MIKEIKVSILEKNKIAENTYEVRFARPKGFKYIAGQYLTIRVDTTITDGRGPSRAFSLSSSPTNKKFISTCLRLPKKASEFKEYLFGIPPQTEVFIKGPFGKFNLPRKTKKTIVMIAGGVGVVPFIGMLRYATEKKSKQKIKLLYTDKSEERMAYYDVLVELEEENKNFSFVNRFKRVDPEFIKENCDIPNSLFYVCGKKELVENITKMLTALGVNEEDIVMEKY
ncbi:MAG: FAD-dependent oxidoreductase [archaeon]|nr:FAD-dependent oxidoreductase [archaeon]MCR4324054.1 FAD-dependent oxidoreductase [Nanoarchaeota archaeon]